MILQNSIRCNNCKQIICSLHRHDFFTCECGRVSVDGGRSYLKRSFPEGVSPKEAYEELSIIVEARNENKII